MLRASVPVSSKEINRNNDDDDDDNYQNIR